jgi:hypothetical protein
MSPPSGRGQLLAYVGHKVVTNNTVAGGLTVKGNTGTVIDRPNSVSGRSKVQ